MGKPLPRINLRELLYNIEENAIKQYLDYTNFNITKTANLLGYQRTTLHEKMKKLQIHRDDWDDSQADKNF